jgi:ATP-dependent DNA helicase
MNDCQFLRQYAWSFIVVDESHRLKNLECKLVQELKSYQSANRLLLTVIMFYCSIQPSTHLLITAVFDRSLGNSTAQQPQGIVVSTQLVSIVAISHHIFPTEPCFDLLTCTSISILPEVFDDYSSFEQWFDLSSVTAASDSAAALSTAQAQHIVTSLHAILKPFLLRRVKSEVETNLPKKKE